MLLLTLFLLASGPEAAPAAPQPTPAVPAPVAPAPAGPAAETPTPAVASAPCIACRLVPGDPRKLYDDADWAALLEGRVVKDSDREGDTAASTQASALIPRPPAEVWEVLTDFESWPGFMPHVTQTRITRRDGGRMWVHQDFRVLLVGMSHTTVYDLAPRDGRLGWSLDLEQEHDIAASEGRWQLVPLESGRQTLVRYRAAMDSGRAVPEFVEDLLLRRSLENLLTALREEVLRRQAE